MFDKIYRLLYNYYKNNYRAPDKIIISQDVYAELLSDNNYYKSYNNNLFFGNIPLTIHNDSEIKNYIELKP